MPMTTSFRTRWA